MVTIALAQALAQCGFYYPAMALISRTDDACCARVFVSSNRVFNELSFREGTDGFINYRSDLIHEAHLDLPQTQRDRTAIDEVRSLNIHGTIQHLT